MGVEFKGMKPSYRVSLDLTLLSENLNFVTRAAVAFCCRSS
jgi:hypothetical protein